MPEPCSQEGRRTQSGSNNEDQDFARDAGCSSCRHGFAGNGLSKELANRAAAASRPEWPGMTSPPFMVCAVGYKSPPR